MAKNLLIVESPAKAKTIESYLGKEFIVASCYGHIRDLSKKNMGIDIKNGFTPTYKIPEDKAKVVKELKKLSEKADYVWLATDEDREGEAISWHLKEVLELPDKKIKRIVFDEITKNAIQQAVANPRNIDYNLVDAQQARRVLDRIVGFELSPILWRKIRTKLSAGRVQSVAVRLIVEREREIDSFVPESRYKVTAIFLTNNGKTQILKAELPEFLKDESEVKEFLNKCKSADFIVDSVEKKPFKRSPAPPFTTSTLQQEAARKLRFSVSKTMLIAQRLYESGHITYMRTDSVNLSDFALSAAEESIKKDFGSEYSQPRKYQTKSATAQEAHEAIRPTDFSKESIPGSKDEQNLYQLIWKRAIASQMSDAQLERTTINIKISNTNNYFVAKGEVILFDGFLKVYLESSDEESEENGFDSILPSVKNGDQLELKEITATERFTRPPARYNEASLVKKLEELGIGRPSTYAPTISTIQKRGYVLKEDREGKEREYKVFQLDDKRTITEFTKTEIYGSEKQKLFPSDLAMLVTDFLMKHFPQIMDYQFTAKVEEELDEIALGKIKYQEMLSEFYPTFHSKVEETIETSDRVSGERILGIDPSTGKTVSVRMARFGPVAQLTNPNDPNEAPVYAGLRKDQKLETITLEEALELFKLPRVVGELDGKEIIASIGRFGPYIKYDNKFISIKNKFDPHTITLEEAISVIDEKQKADSEKYVKIFDEDPKYQILKGRWGVYLRAGDKNVKLPKDRDPLSFTFEEVVKLAEESSSSKSKKRKKSK
ncbi:MAG: type I DNA topoisomerase [Ignavibacterium sp.]|nr:type I DNA topoisomerase [Ignavibacterium sp.]MDW8376428.1 type I DNA topoisomerase [Ignavibacteriales bacterium]